MKTINELRNMKLRQALFLIRDGIRKIAGEGTRLFIYGSYARGEETEDSDVDIMVVLPDEKDNPAIKDAVYDLVFETGFAADFLISPFIVSESTANKFEGFKVFASVEREGIPF